METAQINFNQLVTTLIVNREIIKVTKFVSPTLIARVTRRLYNKRLPAKNQNTEISLTIGRPNYLEREFIRFCKKAGEPFPVKNLQLKAHNRRGKSKIKRGTGQKTKAK